MLVGARISINIFIILVLLSSAFAIRCGRSSISSVPPRRLLIMASGLGFQTQQGVIQSGSSVRVSESSPSLFTLTTSQGLKSGTPGMLGLGGGSSRAAFTVSFKRKDSRTAIGFATAQPPSNTYMTPDYYRGSVSYISMGGAGFIYPAKSRATGGYKEGDRVSVEVDFSSNTVTFSVNGRVVATAPWPSTAKEAYPFISCEGGVLEMEVTRN
jgi:SPRY domain